MCSDWCPCVKTEKSAEWDSILSEEEYKDRVQFRAPTAPYSAGQSTGQSSPFRFQGAYAPLNKEYENYLDCINDSTKRSEAYGIENTAFSKRAIAFDGFRTALTADKDNWQKIQDWITFFETEYKCSGICDSSVFSFSKSVTEGVPTKGCVIGIKDELGSTFTGLGGATLGAGFAFLGLFFFQYCLWKKYDD